MSDDLAEALGHAVGSIVRARLVAGVDVGREVPQEVLDFALQLDGDATRARDQVIEAMERLRGELDRAAWRDVLVIEAAMFDLSQRALAVGWALGWDARGGATRHRPPTRRKQVDDDTLLDALDAAVDAVLLARLQAGPITIRSAPVEALEAALRGHEEYLARREAATAAFDALRGVVPLEHLTLLLDYEAAKRAEAAVADVAFSLGLTTSGRQ